MQKQSGEGRMEPASSVADADGGGACPRPLPTAVRDAIEPFARLVKLLGRGFYTDFVVRDGEVRADEGDDNRGMMAVVILDSLTRFAWIKESELARLLKIKEKTLILLLQFLEKEKFLKRELTKGKQVKIDDAIAEKEDGSFNVLAGSYCCLDYSQIVDVTRYRLHRMKKSMTEKLDCRAIIEEYACCICKRSYSALDIVHLLSKSGTTFRCECKGELVAQNGDASARRESRANCANMLKRFKEQVKPIELQLSVLKNLSVPDFLSIDQWTHTNMVQFVADLSSNNIFETRVEIPLPNSSGSDFMGVKVLPTWIVQKGMGLTKAEKGEKPSNKDERRVGMKAKRSDGGSCGDSYYDVESAASSRRRT